MPDTATLLLSCPDRPGLVARTSAFLADREANIVHADQHTDHEVGLFLQRIEFELDGLDGLALRDDFADVAEELGMDWQLHLPHRQRLAVLSSKEPHCLLDLIARRQMGELAGEIAVVISNHPDHGPMAEAAGIPFLHLPVAKDTRPEQEARIVEALDTFDIDLVVLARYMQILSPALVDEVRGRAINIHHSFLPAFAGARPYHQAHARGVKLIGATAHYVTADLDEGPIIEQDVARVSHRDSVEDLRRKGRDLEKVVLARAVRHHLAHRVVVYGNKTVVFD
jgi:formyltetrahydrofolate deformylase